MGFVMTNVVVCCSLCADGKHTLTGDEYIGLVAHIKSFDEAQARWMREASRASVGRQGWGAKDTPAGGGAAGNAPAALST